VDNPRHTEAIADLDRLHRFFTALEWWLLEPRDELVKADGGYAYCLADPGRTYVIYVVGSRGAYELKLADGNYCLSRYDPHTGRSTELPASAGGPGATAGSRRTGLGLSHESEVSRHITDGQYLPQRDVHGLPWAGLLPGATALENRGYLR